MNRHLVSSRLLFALVLVFYGYFYQAGGWNQNCRFDTVRALAEQGSHRIDSFHRNTGDKAFSDGHYYCDKAPGVAWLATPVYALTRAAIGDFVDAHRLVVVGSYLATLAAVAIPSALASAIFFLWLTARGAAPIAAAGLALAYSLATLVFPYSTTLFGHAPAAALLLGSFIAFSQLDLDDATSRPALVGGFAAAAAVVVEYTAILGCVPLIVYALTRRRSVADIGWLAAGVAIPALALGIYNASLWGDPFTFSYAHSLHPDTKLGAGLGIVGPRLDVAVDLLISERRGLLVFGPWLILAVPGWVRLISSKRYRGAGVLVAAVPILFLGAISSLAFWDGGFALGPRYLIPAIPFLAIGVGGLLLSGEREQESRVPRSVKSVVAASGVALAIFSFGMMLLATSVKVDVPAHVQRPFREFIIPHFQTDRLSISVHGIDGRRAERGSDFHRASWNLGHLAGLSGRVSLMPLVLLAMLLTAWLWASLQLPRRGFIAVEAEPEPSESKEGRAWVLVGLVVLIGAASLYPHWRVDPPQINDSILHEAATEYAVRHWEDHWPVDHWFPSVTAGLPLFAVYPHLSHLTSAAVSRWFVPDVEPRLVYRALAYCLLALMPLSIFVSLRRMQLAPGAAAGAAILFPLLSARGLFGIGWDTYLWGGYGLIPQLWGVFFFFPALGWGHRALGTGRTWAAAALLCLCALSHFLFGYMAAISLALVALVPRPGVELRQRLFRLARLGCLTAVGTAYFSLPLFLHRSFMLRSRWEDSWKWDSKGAAWVLEKLVSGSIFDHSVPVLSIAAVIGVVVATRVARSRAGHTERWLLLCTAMWVLLSFGRATWGRALDLLPLADGLHMHRFVGAVQVFGLILAGLGLRACWHLISRRTGSPGLALLLVSLLLLPMVRGRWERLETNLRWARDARAAIDGDSDWPLVVAALKDRGPGRVHAGFAANWGERVSIGRSHAYTLLQSEGFDMTGYLFTAMVRPAEWQILLDSNDAGQVDLFNVRSLVTRGDHVAPRFASRTQRMGRFALHDLPTSGYFAVGVVRDSRVPDLEISSLGDGWTSVFERGRDWLGGDGPSESVYVALGVEPDSAGASGRGRGRVLHESLSAGVYEATVEVDSPADVILKVTRYPYWQSSVDGVAVPHREVVPGFMAVSVPSGTHQIGFDYVPPRWKTALFAVSLALVAGVLFWPVRSGLLEPRPAR